MITLPNGNKWIIDDLEIKDLNYAEACKGNVPETEIKNFVERLCKAFRHDDKDGKSECLLPRKLTEKFDGYWDCNFDVFKEVLGSIAKSVKSNPWSVVYEMPWDSIVVVFEQADCGGYDAETAVKVYSDYWEYFNAVQIADYHILK